MAAALGNNASDVGELLPMIEAVAANRGQVPEQVLADAGYRSEPTTTDGTENPHHTNDALQLRHVDLEIHPVDALTFEHDVVGRGFADAEWSFHGRLRWSTGSSDPIELRAPMTSGPGPDGSTGATLHRSTHGGQRAHITGRSEAEPR